MRVAVVHASSYCLNICAGLLRNYFSDLVCKSIENRCLVYTGDGTCKIMNQIEW